MDCSFCEEYARIKRDKKHIKTECNANQKIRVRIFEYATRNRWRVFTHTHRTHKLNYCPECGRNMRDKRKQEVV